MNGRERKQTSHVSQFCAFASKQKSHVFFEPKTNFGAQKSYACDGLFKKKGE